MYYYVYNLQGDVTHIITTDGSVVGTYQYDAWGKILNLASLTAIAQANPFRYRGYYYDNESGLYYLNSRYYNAEWGRFINADGYVSTGSGITGYNMFAYCDNNPVNCIDPTGCACICLTQRVRSGHVCETESVIDGISKLLDVMETGVNLAIQLAMYSYKTGVRPNNIGPGTYAKYINAATRTLDDALYAVSGIGVILSAVCFIVSAYETQIDGVKRNVSNEKIAWDIAVDFIFDGGGIAFSTGVVALMGCIVSGPIAPVVLVGTGFVASLIYDGTINKFKERVKGLVK